MLTDTVIRLPQGRTDVAIRSGPLKSGKLVAVLEGYNPGDIEEVHAVFLGQGKHLPARVRALLDFLVAHVDLHKHAQPAG